MNKIIIKSLFPHVIAVLAFILISIAYFPPVLENKTLFQSDVRQQRGMAHEILDYREKTGKFSLWTNSMFSGMPSYLIVTPPSNNVLSKLHKILILNDFRPVCYLFLLMFGFYISLLIFRINPWLSIVGAIAFAFSSNFLILIETGHLSKVQAAGYLPPIIAGVYLAYRRHILAGALITGIFLSLQLLVNHLQITYYTFMIIIVWGIFEFIRSIREKILIRFMKVTGILLVAAFLAIGSNLVNFLLTYEYSRYSIRGKPELSSNQSQTGGLDRDYVTAWSNGIDETLMLFIPNFKGGSSQGSLGENSKTYELFRQAQGPQYAREVIRQLPLYWGNKPFTGGPVYVGAGIFFLFILGLFLVKGPVKWWLLSISILAIMLSWGKNFMVLTDLFLDYFPGYNKFRDVTTLLIITEFTFPLLAIITFQKIIDGTLKREEFIKPFKYVVYVVGGIALVFILLPGAFFDFSSESDTQYINQGMNAFIQAIISDRETMLRNDSVRALIVMILTGGIIYFVFTKRLKINIAIALFGFVMLVDLWTVDKRYLNNDDFIPKRQASEAYQPYQADLNILQDKDLYFRVFDLTTDPFRSTRASYFHKSIGGYHGAKLRRYQDIIEYHLSKNNMQVINMLNTKYFIVPVKNSEPEVRYNGGALGNAWFVNKYRIVESPDEEIVALNNFNPADEAIVDKRFTGYLDGLTPIRDTAARISLTEYMPDRLIYKSFSNTIQLAVFSDIYYEKGWKVMIDDNPASFFRVDYILRAMVISPGNHKIEFSFEPQGYFIGRKVALISSLILLILGLGLGVYEIKKYIAEQNLQKANTG
jgi:hypothetical protein